MILSLDFGTSSLKISILDDNLLTLHSDKETYTYTIRPGQMVEEDPDELLSALTMACGRLPQALRSKIDLICYDSFSPSLVLMDVNGAALSPVITHMDRRSRSQSQRICNEMGAEAYQSISGVFPFTGGVSLTTLLWFMEHEPELMKQTRKIGHLPTYLHHWFTGEWVVDMVNASMMGLYDTVHQSGWSDTILDAFGIPRNLLSPIAVPGSPGGVLTVDAARALGLKSGIPVSVGTNDVVAAHAGAGNNRSGQILNTAGSSDMISILTDRPSLHPGYYVRNAGRPGLWQIYATTSGGFAIEWFQRQFCRELDPTTFYNEYVPKCIALCGDTSVTFDPYLAEDRQSLDHRLAAWHGLGLNSTREEMLSSLLYAMQQVLADVIHLAQKQITMDRVIKVTGGIVNPSMLELKRRVFGNYSFQAVDDCPILGNALLHASATAPK